jgi:spoIIIJ-associated protein
VTAAGINEVEVSGETVGEAKWLALRELERLQPGLDRDAVEFEVLSEGERGLLGVGRTPARVLARARADALIAEAQEDATEPVRLVRELLENITDTLGVPCRIEISEDTDSVTVDVHGADLGLLIGKHGQTVDAVQYLAGAIVHRRLESGAKAVVVDAAGYRERRRERLHVLALRCAEQAVASGRPVELEPMAAQERKIVHLRLEEVAGVETHSEGDEPNRHVVIAPVDR